MKLILSILIAVLCISFTPQPAQKVYINNINNNIKIGPLTGNKNIALGVKNIIEEAVQDKGWILVADKASADFFVDVELIYFDVQQTSTGVSLFHKNDNETIIRIKGSIYNKGKKIKDYIATGKSSEISTSIAIVDEGGGFNQASARSALKKTIINLIEKLL
jgi:hypothetical protein